MFPSSIFRKQSLERLAAPDELDRLLTVVNLRAWIPLATLGALCAAALVWSVCGRIPITVYGRGILLDPGNVKGLTAEATGHLIELPLRVGQTVRQGDAVGVLYQPELRSQLDQAEAKLAELRANDAAGNQLDAARGERERDHQIREARRHSERLKRELERQGQIRSPYTGRVLEITVAVGQLVQAGERIGTLVIDDPDSELKSLAYFAIQDGKLIEPGMSVRVTPATIAPEREGAWVGTVTMVSAFPVTQQGTANLIGSQELAALLTGSGGRIEVEARLERDHNSSGGYRWSTKGSHRQPLAGTTTAVRVTVEQRRPIAYVLPILRN